MTKPKKVYAPADIPADWLAIIRAVPNYDPCKGAAELELVFDADNAAVAIEWIEKHFKHVSGELGHKPYILGAHEKALVANLFGWKRADGTRRYRKALYFIGKGNSKTTLAAAIALLVLTKDPEAGKQIFVASADAETADMLFGIAKEQVLDDPWLAERCEPWKRSIKLKGKPDFFSILSSKAETKHGKIPNLVVIDELHVVERDLVDTLVAGLMKRKQSLCLYLTTSDYDQVSICNDIQDYAQQIIDGTVDDPYFLPIIYKVDEPDINFLRGLKPGEGDRETLLGIFRKANPGLGTSILESNMLEAWQNAQKMPSYLNTFFRLNCNYRTESETMWIDMGKWDQCGPSLGEPKDPENWRDYMEARMKGNAIFAGLDIARTDDFFALVLVWVMNGRTIIFPYLWVPEHGPWRSSGVYRERYEEWIGRGFIITTPGEVMDDDTLLHGIKRICVPLGIRQIGADTTFDGQGLCQRLIKEEHFDIVTVRQNYDQMTGPCIEFEKRITEKKINHGGNPVLRWMVGNTVLRQDASGKQCRPVRSKKRELKIDGTVAAIMALSRLVTAADKVSPYAQPAPKLDGNGNILGKIETAEVKDAPAWQSVYAQKAPRLDKDGRVVHDTVSEDGR